MLLKNYIKDKGPMKNSFIVDKEAQYFDMGEIPKEMVYVPHANTL